jgi:hypothetical protein
LLGFFVATNVATFLHGVRMNWKSPMINEMKFNRCKLGHY